MDGCSKLFVWVSIFTVILFLFCFAFWRFLELKIKVNLTLKKAETRVSRPEVTENIRYLSSKEYVSNIYFCKTFDERFLFLGQRESLVWWFIYSFLYISIL